MTEKSRKETIAELGKRMSHTDLEVRIQAANALGETRSVEAIPHLSRALRPHLAWRVPPIPVLPSPLVKRLVKKLREESHMRMHLISALRRIEHPDALVHLVNALSPDQSVTQVEASFAVKDLWERIRDKREFASHPVVLAMERVYDHIPKDRRNGNIKREHFVVLSKAFRLAMSKPRKFADKDTAARTISDLMQKYGTVKRMLADTDIED